MALDGAFLRHLKTELEAAALGSRVDKIYQPNRHELVLLLRSRDGVRKLLLSTRPNTARLHFTESLPENPKVPPMLCMLLRKRLGGARFVGLSQPGLERVLLLEFDAVNELGDQVRLTLAAELMGRYSNLILVDENGKVVDALKRVDAEMSSERLILPGVRYTLPPPQEKLCLLEAAPEEILQRAESLPAEMELPKALLNTLQGVSPVVCRELGHRIGRGRDLTNRTLDQSLRERALFVLGELKKTVETSSGTPYMVTVQGKPLDFTFFSVEQYGTHGVTSRKATFSELLDDFYGERDRADRMRVKSQDLLRVLTTSSERLSRKINAQRGELEQCAKREELRLCGDLLNANLYRLEKGAPSVELQNFYEEDAPLKTIRLDPALTPIQNAQKYYKDYRKAHTAEQMLTVQIDRAEKELAYLDTVLDELSRAALERDLAEIRAELTEEGYLRAAKGKQKPPAQAAPMAFTATGGFRVLVGRNNRQNDRLTLRQANNNDLWFHTQKMPGSHVILETEGAAPPEEAIREAAGLAALFSRGKGSSQVPVDYTQVRHVSKPQGAKPGMVIYINQKTLYVTPDPALPERLMPNDE